MKTSGIRARVPQAANGAAFGENGRLTPIHDDGIQDPSLISESVAKHMLALVEIMVPRVVAATFAAIQREERVAARRAEVSALATADEKKLNGQQIAAALGCGEWVVYGLKKANRIFADQGKESLIFTGRYSSPAAVSKWLREHPDFVARHMLVTPEQEVRYRDNRAKKKNPRRERSAA